MTSRRRYYQLRAEAHQRHDRQVLLIFNRYARKDRRGRLERCSRTGKSRVAFLESRELTKIVYPTREKAVACAAELSRLVQFRSRHPYQCGDHWHLSSRKDRAETTEGGEDDAGDRERRVGAGVGDGGAAAGV